MCKQVYGITVVLKILRALIRKKMSKKVFYWKSNNENKWLRNAVLMVSSCYVEKIIHFWSSYLILSNLVFIQQHQLGKGIMG